MNAPKRDFSTGDTAVRGVKVGFLPESYWYRVDDSEWPIERRDAFTGRLINRYSSLPSDVVLL